MSIRRCSLRKEGMMSDTFKPTAKITANAEHSHFARHEVDKTGKRTHEWGSDTDLSAGSIAWLLWGGDAGKTWADRHAEMLD
jgi:hypothetical protein